MAIDEKMDRIEEQELYNEQILEMKQVKDLLVNKLKAGNEAEIMDKIRKLLKP